MPWINHLPPVCWSTFGILVWNDSGYVNLTQWWYFFIIFEYILHISTPHIMIFCFPLPYFPLSQQVLYFLLSTLVLTLYIDVVLSLSISIVWNLRREPGVRAENRIFKNFSKSPKTCFVGVFCVFQGIFLALFDIRAENRIFEPRTRFSKSS